MVVCSQFVDDTHVLILNDKNFSDALTEHAHVLVDFYAPWCGHCQHLAPALARAAKMVAEQERSNVIATRPRACACCASVVQAPGSGCRFAKVDVTANDQLRHPPPSAWDGVVATYDRRPRMQLEIQGSV
jgi:thiol-disulfide isomerase/thioredoxin